MLAYIIRRLLYTPLIVFGVLLITFVLFNLVQGDVSLQIAGKNATPQVVAEIRAEYGWDKPLIINTAGVTERGVLALFDSQFFNHLWNSVTFDFGRSINSKQAVAGLLQRGAGPSLTLTVPMFVVSLVVSVSVALFVAFYRGRWIDTTTVIVCVLGMSLPSLAVILYGQYVLAYKFGWFPVFGYEAGWGAARFVVLPALLGVLMGLGSNVRFYRTIMLDEIRADYIRTAYAKGLSTPKVLFKHLLKNAMIPIITSTVLAIPFLFLGSLLLERFFGIPGLGYLMVEAINGRDFPVINAMTFIIAILFVLGNLLTDVCYALVDPRVSLS